jgi:hypothetical protein
MINRSLREVGGKGIERGGIGRRENEVQQVARMPVLL